MRSLFRIWQVALAECAGAVRSRRALVILVLYLLSAVFCMIGTISMLGKMEAELSGRGFLRSQKSYLVNMAHIKKLNSAQVLLSNGVSLPVSSRGYADCKRQYLLWRGRDGWSI